MVYTSLIPVSLLARVLSVPGLMPDYGGFPSRVLFPFHCWSTVILSSFCHFLLVSVRNVEVRRYYIGVQDGNINPERGETDGITVNNDQ